MDPETHKEIVEIKKDIRELRAVQDVEIQHNRQKFIDLLESTLDNDKRAAQVLLEIDGFKSRKDLQEVTGLPQRTCWRKVDKLVSKEIITPLEGTKNGSPVYRHARWFKKLRLEEHVRSKFNLRENKNVKPIPESDQN